MIANDLSISPEQREMLMAHAAGSRTYQVRRSTARALG